jgi:hypothetical protein
MKTINLGPHVKIDFSGDGFAFITDDRNGWADFNPTALQALYEALHAHRDQFQPRQYPPPSANPDCYRRLPDGPPLTFVVDCDGSIRQATPPFPRIFAAELSSGPTIIP